MIDKIQLQKFLDGKLSEADALKVQIWIAAHSCDDDLSSWLDDYFEKMDVSTADVQVQEEMRNVEKRIGLRPMSFAVRLARFAQVAAIAVLCAVLFFSLGRKSNPAPDVRWVEVNVPNGEVRTLCLSDGTALDLNAGTKLLYPEKFSGSTREIFVDGEVVAEVAKDKKHPFIIKSGMSTIKVTGTKFNFKSFRDDSMVEIALMEGSVDYCWENGDVSRNVSLTAGDLMKMDKSNAKVSVSRLNIEKFRTFNDGMSLHFIDEPLCDIAKAIERTFNIPVVIMDNELAQMRFIAYFANNESLSEVLDALCESGEMSATRERGTIIITRN